jgi:hypothetical protein
LLYNHFLKAAVCDALCMGNWQLSPCEAGHLSAQRHANQLKGKLNELYVAERSLTLIFKSRMRLAVPVRETS